MKRTLFILFFCCGAAIAAFANVKVQCTLQNEAGEPLPFAVAYCPNSNSGVAADSGGVLSINVNTLADSIRFSMLGYRTKTLQAADIAKINIVTLSLHTYDIQEVTVSSKQNSPYISLTEGKNTFIALSGKAGNILLVKAYAPAQAGKTIAKVVAVTKKVPVLKRSKIFKLRARIYSVGADSLPEYDLLTQTVEAHAIDKEKRIEADITHCDIIMPADGVFVGFEWLPLEQVVIDYDRESIEPLIATAKTGNKELTVMGSIASDEWRYFSMKDAPFFISKKPRNAKIGIVFK